MIILTLCYFCTKTGVVTKYTTEGRRSLVWTTRSVAGVSSPSDGTGTWGRGGTRGGFQGRLGVETTGGGLCPSRSQGGGTLDPAPLMYEPPTQGLIGLFEPPEWKRSA